MRIIHKDILTIEKGVIAHQVNCKGVMGSGMAKQIKEKFPKVFEEYNAIVEQAKTQNIQLLGKLHKVVAKSSQQTGQAIVIVANCFGQDDYGKEEKIYTDYHALLESLSKAFATAKENFMPIFIPYKIGCVRGGGDWDIVSDIILNIEKVMGIEAIVCKLP